MKTSEYVTLTEATEGPELPYEVQAHCLVQLEGDKVFLIGGGNEVYYFKKTLVYKFATQMWTNGPLMTEKRYGVACGKATDLMTDETIVIAAGGVESKSVEIWIEGTDTWMAGPELDYELAGASGITGFDGAFYVVGGAGKSNFYYNYYSYDSSYNYYDYDTYNYFYSSAVPDPLIHRFTCSNRECNIEDMHQELSTKRLNFAALLVPDEFCEM